MIPFTLKAKILMRALITSKSDEKRKIGWDEPIAEESCKQARDKATKCN